MNRLLRRLARRVARSASARRAGWTVATAVLAVLAAATNVAAGDVALRANAPMDFSSPPVAAGFTNALAVVQAASGFQAAEANRVFPEWRTNLCLILGFQIEEGAKRFVRLVELTTLPALATNASGQSAALPDAKFTFSCGANAACPTGRVYRMVSPRLPVRVRVFDEQGRFLQESRQNLSWQFLTNGLTGACLAFSTNRELDVAASRRAGTNGLAASPEVPASTNDLNTLMIEFERVLVRSLAGLVGLFGDTLGSDALKELRDHAMVVVRSPNWLKAVFNLKLGLSLEPHFERAAFLPVRDVPASEVRALFPAELRQGDRLLTTAELIAGSPAGPHFLTAGIRGLRVVHPTKPDRRLLAQVLAAGTIDSRLERRIQFGSGAAGGGVHSAAEQTVPPAR